MKYDLFAKLTDDEIRIYGEESSDDFDRAVEVLSHYVESRMLCDKFDNPVSDVTGVTAADYGSFCKKVWAPGDDIIFNRLVKKDADNLSALDEIRQVEFYNDISAFDAHINDSVRDILGEKYQHFYENKFKSEDFGMTEAEFEKAMSEAEWSDDVADYDPDDVTELIDTSDEKLDMKYKFHNMSNWRDVADDFIMGQNNRCMDEEEYKILQNAIQGEFTDITERTLAEELDASTFCERYAEVCRKREAEGIIGDEPNIPAYKAEELMNGLVLSASPEEYAQEQMRSIDESYLEEISDFMHEVRRLDITQHMYHTVYPNEQTVTILDRCSHCFDAYRNYFTQHYDTYSATLLRKFERTAGDVNTDFASIMERRTAKDLPWNYEQNVEYNAEVLQSYDELMSKISGDLSQQGVQEQFFKAVYDSTKAVDVQGLHSPTLDVGVISHMSGYEEYQDTRILSELAESRSSADEQYTIDRTEDLYDINKAGVRFDKKISAKEPVVEHDGVQKTETPVKSNEGNSRIHKQGDEKSANRDYTSKVMINSVENGVSNPDYDFDEYD